MNGSAFLPAISCPQQPTPPTGLDLLDLSGSIVGDVAVFRCMAGTTGTGDMYRLVCADGEWQEFYCNDTNSVDCSQGNEIVNIYCSLYKLHELLSR